jgi:hypothetical protein
MMCACLTACAAASFPILAQQDRATFTLRGPGNAGAPVQVLKDGSMVPLGTTDANGALLVDPSLLFGKPRMDAVIQQCPGQATSVNLVPSGAPVPAEQQECPQGCKCKRREGAFLWGDDARLYLDKHFFQSPVGIGAILLGAGATAGFVAAGGDSSNGSGNNPGTNNPGGGTGGGGNTPPPTATAPNSFNGTYNGTAAATSNACGFLNSTPIRAVLNVNGSGAGTWVNTHLTQNQVYNFDVTVNITANQGAFNSTSTSNPWGYVVIDNVTFSGSTATGTQTFRDPSRGNCETRYNLNLTKQQ